MNISIEPSVFAAIIPRSTCGWRIMVFVAAAIAVFASAARATDAPSVVVDQNIRIATSQGPARSVSLRYDFGPRKLLYAADVGEIPPRGSLSLLTFASKIVFSSTYGGPPLLEVDLADSTDLMGAATIEIPALSEFPAASRQGIWPRREVPFSKVARRILEDGIFRSGIVSMEVEGKPALLTPFAELPRLGDKAFARIALLVSYGTPDRQSDFSFDVRFVVQERRSHTAWRRDVSQGTLQVAQDYVAGLLRDLERP